MVVSTVAAGTMVLLGSALGWAQDAAPPPELTQADRDALCPSVAADADGEFTQADLDAAYDTAARNGHQLPEGITPEQAVEECTPNPTPTPTPDPAPPTTTTPTPDPAFPTTTTPPTTPPRDRSVPLPGSGLPDGGVPDSPQVAAPTPTGPVLPVDAPVGEPAPTAPSTDLLAAVTFPSDPFDEAWVPEFGLLPAMPDTHVPEFGLLGYREDPGATDLAAAGSASALPTAPKDDGIPAVTATLMLAGVGTVLVRVAVFGDLRCTSQREADQSSP